MHSRLYIFRLLKIKISIFYLLQDPKKTLLYYTDNIYVINKWRFIAIKSDNYLLYFDNDTSSYKIIIFYFFLIFYVWC